MVLIGYNRAIKIPNPIYTASVFIDGKLRLPLDSAFKKEADNLRNQHKLIAEVGCLATHTKYRKGDKSIPMIGNKRIFRYAMAKQVDELLITIHPKHLHIYEDILLFRRIGYCEHYSYVNYQPAVLMGLNLNTCKNRCAQVYNKKPDWNNLYKFFFEN